ncbi:TPA: hypothetical protein DCW38_08610 [candidate division WOR-3 bacterium]|uniref:Sulfatase-modifying factor enzyme-like domain-containing protein n=1 Tax=candidate division WOR-3 bacterium TaxID=2052148 RepID=A0A350HCF5_UNCW3|nr:hypothetical protein [candidate division WOR-3 bacterium]
MDKNIFNKTIKDWQEKGYDILRLEQLYYKALLNNKKRVNIVAIAVIVIAILLFVVLVPKIFFSDKTVAVAKKDVSEKIEEFVLRIKCSYTDNTPVSNTPFFIYQGSEQIESKKTDGKGDGDVNLPAGKYTLKILDAKREIVLSADKEVEIVIEKYVSQPAKKETVKVVVKEPVKTEPVKQEEKKTVNYNEPKSSPFTFIRVNDKGYYEYKNEKDGSVLIYIPAGEFTMGSESGESDEKPVHKVYLDGYYIMKYEVTNKQYKKFCDETGRSYPSDPGYSGMSSYFTNYPDYPVVEVSWNDAKAYSKWAGLRLPIEAEWEKAARGTDSRTYPWGNGDPGTNRCNYDPGNYTEDGYKYTSPIGSYENGRSPYGCYDMAGNVWEWCSDWYGNNYYRDSEYRNPKGPSSGDYRVIHGGSWDNGAYGIRSALRGYGTPSIMYNPGGFRCSASE